jgi:hypothetical protein
MFRIDNSSAVAVRPAPIAAGTPGFFGRGDAAHGLIPTIMSADWANMMQEENISLLTAAGIAPSKTDTGQVLAALQKLFLARAESAQLLAANGYFQFPKPDPAANSLIMQWGSTSAFAAEGSVSVSFPIQFPNACLVGFASTTLPGANLGQDAWAQTFGKTTTTLGIYMQKASGGDVAWGMSASWLAIGY